MRLMRLLCCFVVAMFSSSLFAALPAPAGFTKGAKFTVAGYTNATGTARSTTLEKFPVLVRLQANSPAGFSYADVRNASAADKNAIDLAFVDMDGNGLPFEIDTWNTSGMSLIWVQLQTMTNGTEFVMCWGSVSSGKVVCNDNPFSNYVGVWHMSEASGTVADSSGHGLAATPSGTASATASAAVSGPVGNGRQCAASTDVYAHSYLSIPSYDSRNVGNTFAVSGWINVSKSQDSVADARLFSRKANSQDPNGWEVIWKKNNKFCARGASGTSIAEYDPSPNFAGAGWKHVFVVYEGNKATIYEDGVQKKSATGGAAPTDNNKSLSIGSYSGGGSSYFVGSVDECRLLDATPSADWAKAEYDSMNNAAFLTAGEAESYGAIVDLSVSVLASAIAYTNATVTVAVHALGSGATSANISVELAATDDFAAPIWSTTFLATEAGTHDFPVDGLKVGTMYFVCGTATNNQSESVSFGPTSFTTYTPGEPLATASVSGRTVSSLSADASVATFGEGSNSCTARLEASTDNFATVAAFAETTRDATGSFSMEVTGLSEFTVYALRLRVTNSWGVERIVGIGSASTLPPSGVAELYVDSLGSGNGLSPDFALPTIRSALDIAGPNFTIWVRGGAGRAYGVTNETDTLPIPATLEGLSIRAYDETPGDAGRALVAISDTYIDDGGRANIISNRAANVTVSGLDFSFGTTSVGKQDVGSCSILWTAAPFTTLENCLLRMPQPTVYAGSGAASPLVICTSKDATNFVVRGCEFRNTRCWSATHGYAPIKVKSNALIACNVFSNVNATVTGQQADLVYGKDTSCYDLMFVSNIVYGANDGGNLSAAFLFGLYPGPKSAEIAFNRFVADLGASGQNGGAITHRVNITFGAQFAEAFSGKEATLVHHNTIIGGQSAFLFNEAQGNKRKNQFFSNLILLDTGGTALVENVKAGTTEFSGGRTTSFIAPSFLRNNAYTGVLTGGNATELAAYDLSGGMEISGNVALVAPLEFICTNDIYSADFYRYKSVRGENDLGRLGWTGENGEYPRYIGALPPYYPGGFSLKIR